MLEHVRLSPEVAAMTEELIATRRDLHAHPELGYQERRTAGIVAARLRELGIDIREGVAETGVIGLLRGARPGPTVLLRADMDALPIVEANEIPYRSQTPGVMHACGHDGHTAILLGAARLLAARREQLAGSVKFIFQPAEEGGAGAQRMIEQGALEEPAVDAAFGLHLWNVGPLGAVGVREGPMMACSDVFDLTVMGKGGHAAAPHRTIDPVVIAAHLIVALQTLVSRETDPLQSAVVTVGRIQGGEARNVIPDQVLLQGTIRTFDPELREAMPRRLERVARGVTEALGGTCELSHRFGYPCLVNDAAMAEIVRAAARPVVGEEHVVVAPAVMGAEDMSYFLQRVPGCFFRLGSANAARGLDYGHHHPRFDFDEAALPVGVEILAGAAQRFLAELENAR
jgi:amidohydrolase